MTKCFVMNKNYSLAAVCLCGPDKLLLLSFEYLLEHIFFLLFAEYHDVKVKLTFDLLIR